MVSRRKRLSLYVAATLAAILAISYVGDYAVLRYRVASNKNPFGQVTVSIYFATPLKNGREEYDFQQPQDQRCVNALYPHMEMQPCWYLSRHREQRVNTM